MLAQNGYEVSETTVLRITQYLADKGLVTNKIINNTAIGIKRMVTCITPMGVDVLEGTVQVDGIMLGD
ncbi:MAG: hypothetical protein FWC16_00615 [Defluviitaleaceae bacterium]|nr:hypothetical protein [Defluviitaleaceae bacterium]MCL2273406.1 hypothetical protein [Defluviitaleaceae bacterium]